MTKNKYYITLLLTNSPFPCTQHDYKVHKPVMNWTKGGLPPVVSKGGHAPTRKHGRNWSSQRNIFSSSIPTRDQTRVCQCGKRACYQSNQRHCSGSGGLGTHSTFQSGTTNPQATPGKQHLTRTWTTNFQLTLMRTCHQPHHEDRQPERGTAPHPTTGLWSVVSSLQELWHNGCIIIGVKECLYNNPPLLPLLQHVCTSMIAGHCVTSQNGKQS